MSEPQYPGGLPPYQPSSQQGQLPQPGAYLPPAAAPGTPYQLVATDPGKTMGIVGLVLSFLGGLAIVGFILSLVARHKSKKAGFSNTPALVGIIVGAVVFVITVIVAIVIIVGVAHVMQQCNILGPGTHVVGGVTYNCG